MDPNQDLPPPPYSETDIYSQPGNPPSTGPSSRARHADDAVSSSTEDVQYTPPLTPTTAQSVAAEPRPAVAAFFDSRPAPWRAPSERLEHTIAINAGTSPQDLTPHSDFAARDVSEQDWRTFVNFLLPDHAARSNEAVVDRKLRAESDAGSSPGEAQAQLGSIRSDDGSQSQSAPPREDIERTVEEWNTFFFGPRGISIRLAAEPDARQMPGAWDESFNSNAANTGNAANANTNAARDPGNSFSWGLGGIRVTQDGISIGNLLEAHRQGVRVGQVSVDHDGITYGGRPLIPTQARGYGGAYGRGYGRGYGGGYGGSYGAGCHAQAAPFQPRRAQTAPANERKAGSSTSESDSESSDGDEVEEMLDYDDLLDDDDNLGSDQFNVCSEALKRWLNAPTQHVTKTDLRALKGQLRVLKLHRGALPPAERKQSKKELKALLKAVRSLIKRQKQERRQVRRQEKQQRRAERREVRQQQREVRRARRDHARGRHCPPAPAAPHAPHAPPAPPAPAGHPWSPFGGRGGRGGRPCGAYQGREGFFPHHVAPYGWPNTGAAGQNAHRSRYDSYNLAVQQLEERVAERTATLSRLESEMASSTSGRGWSARRMEGRKHGLEKEIEALQSSMEGLQVKADNEYAQIVAAEDAAKA